MNQEPVTSLKGIGEKTGALFRRLGVETIEDLLHDYPRAYEAYEPALPIGQAEEGKLCTVSGQLLKTADVRRFQNMRLMSARPMPWCWNFQAFNCRVASLFVPEWEYY